MWTPWSRKRQSKRSKTQRTLRAETLDKRQLLAANIFHNAAMPEDVNEDGVVSAIDALTVINQLNRQSGGDDLQAVDGGGDQERGRRRMTDVNNDGRNTALDALMIINRLSRQQQGPGDRDVPVDSTEDQTGTETPVDEVVEEEGGETVDDVGDEVSSESGDVVLQWNDVFGDVLADSTENQNPGYASRSQAILNLAIYDTVAVAGSGSDANTFYDYGIDFNGAENLNTEVAAAQAAYTVLRSLYPDQQPVLDEALESSLADYQGDEDFSDSRTLGTEIANEILAIRADDGSDAIVDYTYSDEAGFFQADPLNPDVPVWGPGWGDVDTFAISSSDDFRPETTPALTSDEYAASYNEVLELGSVDSETRTADQTEAGIFWAYDREGLGTPIALFNDILQTVAAQEGNTLEENAALFAQASVAMADAGIVAWDTKFTEEFWRPVSAIHDGDIDGNELTEGDPDWVALGAPDGGDDEIGFTPQFPTYISGHATFGAALFGSLQAFYGTDDISFDVTSEELEILLEDPELQSAYGIDLDDATRSFSSFSEAMAENGRSRVYLGIHFDFDDTVGQEVGQAVAASVAAEFAATTADDEQGEPDIKGQPRNQVDRQLQIVNQNSSQRDVRRDRVAAVDDFFRRELF